MDDLFGEASIPSVTSTGSLARRWGEAPFSTLDRRTQRWRSRSAAWRSLGIQSERGRDGRLIGYSDTLALPRGRSSIFDHVLAELAYRWYSQPGDVILDPFAGGSVRGIVASVLARHYIGIDLRAEQVQENRSQASAICRDTPPMWVVGDADEQLDDPDIGADLVFTCPPYYDLERYSDDPADLSSMTPEDFETTYRRIIAKSVGALRPDRFIVMVVGDTRGRDGYYHGLPWVTIDALRDAGAALYQDTVILDPHGTMQIAAGRTFASSRKLTRLHQYMIVAVKGDWREASSRLRAGGAA